jgi:hypothetical protein
MRPGAAKAVAHSRDVGLQIAGCATSPAGLWYNVLVTYQHTQKAPLYLIVLATAAAQFGLAVWFMRVALTPTIVLVAAAILMVIIAFCFRQLTVRDEGEHLAIRYGPLPIFRRRVPYSKIMAVEVGRSSLIDGWGIHYCPGRGTVYNLWGFWCAVVRLDKKTIRIGTDDVEGLVAFIKTKVAKAEGHADSACD